MVLKIRKAAAFAVLVLLPAVFHSAHGQFEEGDNFYMRRKGGNDKKDSSSSVARAVTETPTVPSTGAPSNTTSLWNNTNPWNTTSPPNTTSPSNNTGLTATPAPSPITGDTESKQPKPQFTFFPTEAPANAPTKPRFTFFPTESPANIPTMKPTFKSTDYQWDPPFMDGGKPPEQPPPQGDAVCAPIGHDCKTCLNKKCSMLRDALGWYSCVSSCSGPDCMPAGRYQCPYG